MSAGSFTKGYVVGLLTLGLLDIFTANKAEQTMIQTKKQMLNLPKTEIISNKQFINNTDTLNTIVHTPARTVPDSLINNLNKF